MKIFKSDTPAIQICCVLYEERLNADYKEILDNSGYGYIVSPLHTPDNKDKKPHRHCIIKDMHGHNLNFEKIEELLENLNSGHSPALVLVGGLDGLKKMARYFAHQTKESRNKEQFDFTNPDFDEDCKIDDNGRYNGLVNVFAPKIGYIDGGGLDWLACLRLTIREKADQKADYLNEAREHLLAYIYSNCCCNFADFVKYALSVGYQNAVISDNNFYYHLIKDMRDSQHKQDTLQSIIENDEIKQDIENAFDESKPITKRFKNLDNYLRFLVAFNNIACSETDIDDFKKSEFCPKFKECDNYTDSDIACKFCLFLYKGGSD